MSLARYVLPQPQVVGSEAVDRAIGQLDVDLAAQHGHPAAAWGRVELGKLGGLVDLDRAAGAGLQRLQDGVILAEFFHDALAIIDGVHAKNAHLESSLAE